MGKKSDMYSNSNTKINLNGKQSSNINRNYDPKAKKDKFGVSNGLENEKGGVNVDFQQNEGLNPLIKNKRMHQGTSLNKKLWVIVILLIVAGLVLQILIANMN